MTWTAPLLPLLLAIAPLAHSQVAGLKPPPGSIADGKITIPAAADPATEIPITIIHGAKPGPTLAVIAGLNGTDYTPINAAQALAVTINPAQLSGSVIFVPVANLPAFADRSIYLNPVDHKELALAFPGKADGTVTERIAHAITTQVIEKADTVIILEAGGANTILAPHVFQFITSDAKNDTKSAAMVLVFGINYIVTEHTAKSPKNTIESAAIGRSKLTLKVVCGSLGVADTRTTDTAIKGVLSVMNLLEMIPDNAAKTRSPIYIDRLVTIDSPGTGVLNQYASRAQEIRKGEPLFAVLGLNRKKLHLIESPVDGIVLSMITTPPVNKGEHVALIGIPRAGQ